MYRYTCNGLYSLACFKNLGNENHCMLFLHCFEFLLHLLPLNIKSVDIYHRSLCSLVCKWSYHADNQGTKEWNQDFYRAIGLEDLLNDDALKIGKFVKLVC